jgi:DNA-binding transcriptional MerR regulator
MANRPEMSETRLTFKEMCTKFDVTPRTLRYYEYIELLSPEREGRTRFYTSREVARMTLILRGRRWGFALEELRQWLLLYEEQGTEAQNQAWLDMSARQIATLHERKSELEAAIEELQAKHDEVAQALDAEKASGR